MLDAFAPLWFVFLAVAVLLLPLSRYLLKDASKEKKSRVLLFLGIFVLLYLAVYKIALSRDTTYDFSWWNELPLNLCNLAPIFLIFASALDCKPLYAYLYLNCSLGAIVALVVPEAEFVGAPLLSARGLGYWGFHFLVMFLALVPIVLGVYRPKLRDVWVSGCLLFLSACVMHGVNALMRATVYEKANFFFTYGLEGNALADLLYGILPVNLLWLLLMTPVYAAVGCLMVLVVRLAGGKKEKKKKETSSPA